MAAPSFSWIDAFAQTTTAEQRAFLTNKLRTVIDQDPHATQLLTQTTEAKTAQDITKVAEKTVQIASSQTTKDNALFFSGVHRALAEETTLHNPQLEMIHTTPLGILLVEFNLFARLDIEEAYRIWFDAGKSYAQNASGNITLIHPSTKSDIVLLGQDLPPENTFRSIELPFLLANNNVSTINHVDKWFFEPLVTSHHSIYEQHHITHKNRITQNTDRIRLAKYQKARQPK